MEQGLQSRLQDGLRSLHLLQHDGRGFADALLPPERQWQRAKVVNECAHPVQLILVVPRRAFPSGFADCTRAEIDRYLSLIDPMERAAGDAWRSRFVEVGCHVIPAGKAVEVDMYEGQTWLCASFPSGVLVRLHGPGCHEKCAIVGAAPEQGPPLTIVASNPQPSAWQLSWNSQVLESSQRVREAWRCAVALASPVLRRATRAAICCAALVPVTVVLGVAGVVPLLIGLVAALAVALIAGFVAGLRWAWTGMASRGLERMRSFTPSARIPGVMTWVDVAVALTEVPAPQQGRRGGTGARAIHDNVSLRLLSCPEAGPSGEWSDQQEGEAFEALVALRLRHAAHVFSGRVFQQFQQAACSLAGGPFWPEMYLPGETGTVVTTPMRGSAADKVIAARRAARQVLVYRLWLLGTSALRAKMGDQWASAVEAVSRDAKKTPTPGTPPTAAGAHSKAQEGATVRLSASHSVGAGDAGEISVHAGAVTGATSPVDAGGRGGVGLDAESPRDDTFGGVPRRDLGDFLDLRDLDKRAIAFARLVPIIMAKEDDSLSCYVDTLEALRGPSASAILPPSTATSTS